MEIAITAIIIIVAIWYLGRQAIKTARGKNDACSCTGKCPGCTNAHKPELHQIDATKVTPKN